jgi:replicative DNA helicase
MKNKQDSHSQGSEEMILGGLLYDNSNIDFIDSDLQERHFYFPLHQEFFKFITTKIKQGDVCQVTDLILFLQSNFEKLKVHFGRVILENDITKEVKLACVNLLNSYTYSTINLKEQSKTIIDCYIRREFDIVLQNKQKELAKDYTKDAGEIISALENDITKITTMQSDEDGLKDIAGITENTLLEIEKLLERKEGELVGLSTGLEEIDKLTCGLQAPDLIIVAGRASMGKTSICMNIAANVAKTLTQDQSVAIFSLEMSSEQLVKRMIACETGVSLSNSATTNKTDAEKEYIKNAVAGGVDVMRELPINIDDTARIPLNALKKRCMKLARKKDLKLIVIDYLQLITTESKGFGNRVQEVSLITAELKGLAKKLNVPIIALSQLSRQLENREDKTPQLSDLRESGSIEQDADIVAFVYREEYYLERVIKGADVPSDESSLEFQRWLEENEGKNQQVWDRYHKSKGKGRIIFAKHRNGSVGAIDLKFDNNTTKFSDLDD